MIDKKVSEQIALRKVADQLRTLGWQALSMPRNSPEGDIHAVKDGRRKRIEVKGLGSKAAVFLTKRQVRAVNLVIVYIVSEDNVWVLSSEDAMKLLEHYRADFIERNGRTPGGEGWNKTQFPAPTGWGPLEYLLK